MSINWNKTEITIKKLANNIKKGKEEYELFRKELINSYISDIELKIQIRNEELEEQIYSITDRETYNKILEYAKKHKIKTYEAVRQLNKIKIKKEQEKEIIQNRIVEEIYDDIDDYQNLISSLEKIKKREKIDDEYLYEIEEASNQAIDDPNKERNLILKICENYIADIKEIEEWENSKDKEYWRNLSRSLKAIQKIFTSKQK